ncbi:MAG: hypothetical protein M1818_000796 [Claussenomyces sp. TS43310]|nr:MAG: hypothetical protein M1818_000796 [Claussenomyces sp. TS43310]
MATGQYNYPPPPPPPPQNGPPAGYHQYQQSPYGPHQSPRGGGRGRGRAGSYNQDGRGDLHASSPYPSHAGGYNGQHPVAGGYVHQNPAPYIGPQAPPPAQTYPPPQWGQPQEHHPQQQSPQVPMQHQPAPPPVPLSAQNYHPNYAPQVYQQPPQQQPHYGPQQPFQHSPPPNSYPQHAPNIQPLHPSGPPQQWQGLSQTPPSYSGAGRGRGRGPGHPQGRGGFDAPLMGPPIRMGFDNDRSGESMPQASNGYPQPYVNAQHSSPPVPFSQPAYQGYSPQGSFQPRGGHQGHGGRTPLDPNPFHSNGQNHRGRGGFHHRGNKRDFADKMRHRNAKNRDSNGSSYQNSIPSKTPRTANVDSAKSGEGKKKKKKKRKTNTLGLTPATEEYEESEEEDDVDEESRLAAAANDSAGEIPKMPSDLASWLAERKNRWPTKARREAKEAELAERRARAAEQSARDKARAKKEREERETLAIVEGEKGVEKDTKPANETKLEKQQRKAEKLRRQLERAEQKLQDAMKAGTKRKRDTHDTGDDEVNDGIKQERDVTIKQEGDMVDQVIAKATAAAEAGNSNSDSDESSEYTTATDSDDEPETHSSRQIAPTRVPAPTKKPILERQCKYFSTGGTCGKKGKCRFLHDQAVREEALREKDRNGGRITLAQRLVQNDREKDDLTVVKSIKYLWAKGMLKDPEPSGSYTNSSEVENVQEPAYSEQMTGLGDYGAEGEIYDEYMGSEV